MKLYLIRHGKPAETTGDSGLGEEGRKQAEMLANLFRQLVSDPEGLKILSSNAQRANRTAKMICEALDLSLEEIALFPAPGPPTDPITMKDRLMEKLRKLHSQGSRTIIVVGHWPYLSNGLAWLVGDDAMQFPQDYGAVASLDCSETFNKTTGHLEWFMTPYVDLKPKAIQYLRSLHALVEVDNHGNAVKVFWGKHSEVTDTGLEYLSTLTTLVNLELSQMTDARLAYLSNLINLETLDLGNSAQITDAGLPNLVNLKKLKSLNLSENSFVTVKGLEQLKGLSEIRLKGLSELRYLGVPSTLSLKYVQHFPLLEIVYAFDTNDSEIQYLEKLNNIQELYIASSTFDEKLEITDASVKTLIQLKSLKILYLWDTQISEQGLKQIQNELPNCKIDFATINDEKLDEFEDNTAMSILKRKMKHMNKRA